MKRTFLKFSAKSGATLPKIISRRMHIGEGRHNIAYKSDAPEDEDELTEKLDNLRRQLQKSLSREQKDQLENMIEITEGKLEKSLAKKTAELTEKMANGEKTIVELKAANDAAILEVKSATEKVGKLEILVAEQKERADKNQGAIDTLVVNKSKQEQEQNPKTLETRIAEAIQEKADDIAKFQRKETNKLVIDLKVVGDMYTTNVTGSRWGSQFAPSIIQQPYRETHVRDLLQVSPAGKGTSFTFMKENTTGEGNPAPTAETSTKPQFDLDLVEAEVKFETIAGWMRISRRALDNIPGITAFLQQRLPEKLMRVEDAQILYGDGNTPNLKGIGTSGNYTAATSTADILAERIIDALSQLQDSNERNPTGVVLRPKEYYNFFKNKAGGSGEYDLPRNFTFVNGVLYVSGVPVIPTTAVTDGDFFVGDWRNGAQLFVQEAMRLEFFEQDGTNVRENKITVRIEETVALPVYGASYFIKDVVPDES